MRLAPLVVVLLPLLPTPDVGAQSGNQLDELVATFEAETGARLVFEDDRLPDGAWFEIKRELDEAGRIAAARIAIAEARNLPRGHLGKMGLEVIGVFEGLASHDGDGFRPWSKALGGYRYFGQWNGADAVIAAFYSDEQLPLTFHHEVFHHLDEAGDGFGDDDARLADALDGDAPYPAAAIDAADLAALEAIAGGDVLEEAVSDYAAKAPGEDQAETARWMMSHLPDALVQVARRPELAGSQRILHVLGQYASTGADLAWFVDVALGRDALRAVRDRAGALDAELRARIAPGGDFVVWGREDADGVNQTLRGDIARFGRVARSLRRAADGIPGAGEIVAAHLTADLELLEAYRDHIAARWTISAGTERAFARARQALLDGIAEPASPDNPYLDKVDAEIADPDVRAAIRRVQPAAVRIGGGSGVNLDPRGVILTAAHVVDALGTTLTVKFPDGTEVTAETTAYDATLDLAVLEVDGAAGLAWAPIAADAPATGTAVIVVGQPGTRTPDGDPTGYQPWHVSTGEIRGFRGQPLGDQSLGGTKHDAWTYWGHSGSPLFDETGRIVALHNSWDSTTAMRHAVRHEAIVHFLDEHSIRYTAR